MNCGSSCADQPTNQPDKDAMLPKSSQGATAAIPELVVAQWHDRALNTALRIFLHWRTAGTPQSRRLDLVKRATSLGGTDNADRAPTLPYDLVEIDDAVLAAVHLSQAFQSVLVQRPSRATSWRRTFNIPRPNTTSSSPLVHHPVAGPPFRIAAVESARDPLRRVGPNALGQHSAHAALLRPSCTVPSVSARRSSCTPPKVPVNDVRP
jgi:hypothetical protein